MRRMVEKMLRCYGQEIRLIHNGEETVVFGFLQPITGKGENMGRVKMTALGSHHERRYTYIGPAEPAAAIGDELTAAGKTYFLRKAEQFPTGEDYAYTWGICEEKGGEDNWGRNG